MTGTPIDEVIRAYEALDAANIPGRTLLDRVQRLIADRDKLWDQLEASARRSDRERLVESLDEDRSHLLMLLADLALDAGSEGEAKGWGWLALYKKWPYFYQSVWWWSGSAPTSASHALMAGLIDHLDGSNGHKTQSEALLAVVDAIASGRWKPNRKEESDAHVE